MLEFERVVLLSRGSAVCAWLNTRFRGKFRALRLADEAVPMEPVSASKFPANREINREFGNLGPRSAVLAPPSTSDFNGLQSNSLHTRTGNFWSEQGNLIDD
jgi:hypothetical protein